MGRRSGASSAALVASVLFLFSPATPGRIRAIPSIAALTQAAPVIVVGEIVKVEKLGVGEVFDPDGKPYPADRMAATVSVDEVLKGNVTNSVIQVDYFENPNWEVGPVTNALAEKTYRMLFLKADANGYGFAVSDSSSLPMSRSRMALPQPPGPDEYTRVLQRLAEAMFCTEATSQDRVLALSVIGSGDSAFVSELFRSALAGPAAASDLDLRLSLLASLVARKDMSALPELEASLFAVRDPQYANARANMIFALQAIDAPTAAPILVRALKLPESQLRMYAAMALKATPCDAAIDGLLADLDDPDPIPLFQVMEALSYLTHESFWRPRSTIRDEWWNTCLKHWKDFAAARGRAPAP